MAQGKNVDAAQTIAPFFYHFVGALPGNIFERNFYDGIGVALAVPRCRLAERCAKIHCTIGFAARMPFHLGDNPARFCPAFCLVSETVKVPLDMAEQPSRAALEQVGDVPLQNLVGPQPKYRLGLILKIESPRPVPRPADLVVNKGSNAF